MSWKRKLEKSWGRLGMKYKLSEVMELIGGGTPKTGKPEYWNGDIPWISVKDFNNDLRYVYKTEKTITKLGFEKSSTKLLQRGDVIISARGTVGEIATVPFSMAFNQSCYGLRARTGIVTSDYLYYLIKYNVLVLKKNTHGSVFDTITRNTFDNIEVELPSIEIQEKIASILSDYDEKIELNNVINNNLLQQIQLLCRSWLVDYAPFGYEQPATWSVVPLSLIADFVSGYSYKGAELADSDIAMATIKNFDRKGGFKLDGYKEIQPSAKLKPEQHAQLFDTLVAHTDLTQNAEVIGNAEPILSMSGYNDIVFSMDVVKVLPKEGVSRFLIAALLQDGRFKAHALGYVNGTTVLHLSKKALPEFELLLPPDLEELAPLANAVEAMYRKIADNIDESTHLANLRNTLLPRFMSGELDVSNIDL